MFPSCNLIETVKKASEVPGSWYITVIDDMFCATRERPAGCNYIRVENEKAFIESNCDNTHNSTMIWRKEGL